MTSDAIAALVERLRGIVRIMEADRDVGTVSRSIEEAADALVTLSGADAKLRTRLYEAVTGQSHPGTTSFSWDELLLEAKAVRMGSRAACAIYQRELNSVRDKLTAETARADAAVRELDLIAASLKSVRSEPLYMQVDALVARADAAEARLRGDTT